jgi:6-phosphogluconolactonase/glucosamine-6-phosphate isomerase/deaminase
MRVISSRGQEEGISDLARVLINELALGHRVLWLFSGGSNISASIKIMREIPEALSKNLSIMPGDERYGEVGHSDSNWTKLIEAGLEPQQATLLPVLKDGLTFQETGRRFGLMVEETFAANDYIVGQFGIGEDGHIAGILPGSSAAMETASLVVEYEAKDYDRLTLTFPALKRLDATYAFAYGANKHRALEILIDEDLDPSLQPAQILKILPEANLYSDQLNDIMGSEIKSVDHNDDKTTSRTKQEKP